MTLKEIAKIAGVSIATVSYALNDSDKVSDSVKKKILKIAEEGNYQPDKRAQSLRTGRTKLIGILTEDISFVFTSSIIQGVYKFAEENNYHVVLSDTRLKEKIGSHYENTPIYKAEINKQIDFLLGYHRFQLWIGRGVASRDRTSARFRNRCYQAIHGRRPLVEEVHCLPK